MSLDDSPRANRPRHGCCACFEDGVAIGAFLPNSIRLATAFVATEADIDRGLAALDRGLGELDRLL